MSTAQVEKIGTLMQSSAQPVHNLLESVGKAVGGGVTIAGNAVEKYVSVGSPCQVSERIVNGSEKAKSFSSSAYRLAEDSVANTTKLLQEKVGKCPLEQQDASVSKWKTLAFGSIVLAEGVYDGLVDGTGYVGTRVGESVSEIVSKKWGDEAGQVTRNLNDAIGNGYNVVFRAFKEGLKRGLQAKSNQGNLKEEVRENGECSGSTAVFMENHESGEILQNEINKDQ